MSKIFKNNDDNSKSKLERFFESDEDIRDEILGKLYEKYGREFIGLSLFREYTDTLHCYEKGTDPVDDLVYAERTITVHGVEYRDTYFGIIIHEAVEADVVGMLSEINLPVKAFYSKIASYYNNIFDGTKNYEDFKNWIADGNPRRFEIAIVISLDEENEREDYAKRVFKLLIEAGFRSEANLYFVPDEFYTMITRNNRLEILRNNDFGDNRFTKTIG